jgi:ATP-dependent RNA helicase DOB1
MYNTSTENKIKDIPTIGKIDTDRLPQELTRIYAQIVSLRKVFTDGVLNFQSEELINSLKFLRELSSNLETILLVNPRHEQKESIAFVAASAHSLAFKILNEEVLPEEPFQINTISPYVSAAILFLIANSQPDASEIANLLSGRSNLSPIQNSLIDHIIVLSTGRLEIIPEVLTEKEVINENDLQETALNFLWLELTKGINLILKKISGNKIEDNFNYFDNVINLSIQQKLLFGQSSLFAGPNRLAKLLSISEIDILERAVVYIPCPIGVDPTPWGLFLKNISKERPFLWENHLSAIEKGFLQIGISTILTLPTGAGKSTLSELKLATSVFAGKRAIYIVPTHALEDQINKNLRKIFSSFKSTFFESDGEYTEIDEIDKYPILVMTPEKCLTLINTNEDYFKDLGLVVFDEFHLIHGKDIKKDRRSIDAMFCLLSLFTLVPKADFLLISAMVENGGEISDWVQKLTKRPCLLFNSSWKPTRQLHGCLVFDNAKVIQLNRHVRLAKNQGKTKGPSIKLKREMKATPECIFSMKNIWETSDDKDYFRTKILDSEVRLGIGVGKAQNWYLTSNRNEIAANLAAHFVNLGLKTLVFVDNPIVTNSTAKIISESIKENSKYYSEYLDQNQVLIKGIEKELGSFTHSYFYTFQNVAVHHGSLLPIERTLIEKYFKSNQGAAALIATATLAQGINLPAEIVIIAGDDRYDGDESTRERVQPHELLNAAGRAGRAGLSSQGAVILIPGEIVTIDDKTISNRWWELKNLVFSKGDQCLKIDDPLGYYLDSLQTNSDKLEDSQISVLYRFKSEKLPIKDTQKIINNSFYAFKAIRDGKQDLLSTQIELLLEKRKQLDSASEDEGWINELSYKLSVDPGIISELNKFIELQKFEELCFIG